MSDETIRRVRAVRFAPVSGPARGYRADDVDRFLLDLAGALGRGGPAHELLRAARFPPTRRGRRYPTGEVDALLATVVVEHSTAGSGAGGPAAAAVDLARRIDARRFTTAGLAPGYVVGDVETLLVDLRDAALRGTSLAAVAHRRRVRTSRLRGTYAVDEVDAFLAGLGLTAPAR